VRNRKEVVFYFLARILENEEQESRWKKVKDTPQMLCRNGKHGYVACYNYNNFDSRKRKVTAALLFPLCYRIWNCLCIMHTHVSNPYANSSIETD